MMSLFFSPAEGGSLVEMDYKPRGVNFSNTLSRWYEGYHHKLTDKPAEAEGGGAKSIHDTVMVKEPGLEKFLKFDTRRRASLVERFIGKDETLKKFFENDHKELGDFCGSPYAVSIDEGGVVFSRSGNVSGKGFCVKKDIRFRDSDSFSVVTA